MQGRIDKRSAADSPKKGRMRSIGRRAGRIGAADSPRTKKPLSLIPETGAKPKGLNHADSPTSACRDRRAA